MATVEAQLATVEAPLGGEEEGTLHRAGNLAVKMPMDNARTGHKTVNARGIQITCRLIADALATAVVRPRAHAVTAAISARIGRVMGSARGIHDT